MLKRGKVIAIEGTDGCGKKTQVEAICKLAYVEGFKIDKYSFPRYFLNPGKAITFYLSGKYSDPTKESPMASALLFAIDRAMAIPSMEDSSLSVGRTVICDRYTGSNLAHQGAKEEGEERKRIISGIEELEYEVLKIPRPDLTILLDLPIEIALDASRQRGEQDGHEINEEYQRKVYETYLWLAKNNPNWIVIGCINGNRRKTIEELTSEIFGTIKHRLQ